MINAKSNIVNNHIGNIRLVDSLVWSSFSLKEGAPSFNYLSQHKTKLYNQIYGYK